MKRNKIFFSVILLLCLMIVAIVYGVSVAVRFWPYQSQLIGPVGKLYETDPELGFRPAAHAQGKMRLPDGSLVETYHDGAGHRTAPGLQQQLSGEKHPRILFIGDSFTYGDFTRHEHTFAYRVAEKLGGEAINGGVNGYGLAQMELMARKLIPEYKPDYVVVQYSPWLVARAMSEFGPSYLPIHIPVPYFRDAVHGSERLEIARPPYLLMTVEGLPDRLLLSSRFVDKLHLYFFYVIPNFAYDDVNFLWFRLKQLFGIRAPASDDAAGIVKTTYADISELAKANGGEMLILVLSSDAGALDVPGRFFPPGVHGVNGQRALLQKLSSQDNAEYVKKYWRWGGKPAQPMDAHPNEWGHEVIADAVAERIRRRMAGK